MHIDYSFDNNLSLLCSFVHYVYVYILCYNMLYLGISNYNEVK